MIDEVDKRIISLIQGDLPLATRPFAVLAKRVGISEDDFVKRVQSLRDPDSLGQNGEWSCRQGQVSLYEADDSFF